MATFQKDIWLINIFYVLHHYIDLDPRFDAVTLNLQWRKLERFPDMSKRSQRVRVEFVLTPLLARRTAAVNRT